MPGLSPSSSLMARDLRYQSSASSSRPGARATVVLNFTALTSRLTAASRQVSDLQAGPCIIIRARELNREWEWEGAPAGNNGNGGLPMDASVVFLDCPAYMDKTGSVRCGLPAEVQGRYLMKSTDGPLESARSVPARPLVQRPGRVADVRGAPGRRG